MKYIIEGNKIKRIDIFGLILKGSITNINKERRTFSGFSSVEIIDRQGDFLPISEFEKVMPILMKRGALIMDSHSNHPVGKIISYEFKDTDNNEKGLYLTAEIFSDYPTDDKIWEQIKNGELSGFSLGGKAGTKTPQCSHIGCYNILGDIEAWEFSVVSRPANQSATIKEVNKLAKASDVVDEIIYTITKDGHIITKERVYIKSPSEAPKDVKIETGERGGRYYESERKNSISIKEINWDVPQNLPKNAKIYYMSPKEYIERINITNRYSSDRLKHYGERTKGKFLHYPPYSKDSEEKLLRAINQNNKMDIPSIYYDENGIVDTQEGFHRALSAEKLGINKIPVLVFGDLPKNWKKPIKNWEDEYKIYEEFYRTQKSYTIKDGHIIQKSLANYKDFAQCVTENKDKGDPNAYCGAIKHKVEKRADFTLDDAKRIGDQLNIDWTKIDQNEFLIGLNIELEHGTKFPETNITDDDEIATAKIALAHLNEFPDYYNEGNGLPEMEKRLKGIKKGKIYVDNPQEAPKDKRVQEGKRGGLYYESEGIPKQEIPKPKKLSMTEYFKRISELTGTKLKMGNPVTRALYEGYSIDAGHWLTSEEFENELKLRQKHI